MNFTINVKHKKNYFYIHLFLLIILSDICSNYIVLPFKSINIKSIEENSKGKNEIEKIISILDNDIIYTSVSFAEPSSSIDFYFSMEQYPTSINQNICLKNSKSYYSPQKSKGLKNIGNDCYSEKCSLYKDLNLTENITINSFLFYSNKNKKTEEDFLDNKININFLKDENKYCGIIGLSRFPYNSDFNLKSFIYNLKKNNYINSYSFGFFFFNNNKNDNTNYNYDGFLIVGANYNDNIDVFDTNFKCSVYVEEGTTTWSINFERIFYYENINGSLEYISTNNTKAEFIIDLNYIISDEQYYEDLKKIYFQKFFDNNTCYEEKSIIDGKYTYMIICNINFKENMKSFPCLYFFSEHLFFAFNLGYEDLFYEHNNKIYFLIIRKEHIKDYWKIGKIFLKKYPFIFDYDKKVVSYVYLNKKWNPKMSGKKKEKLINNNDSKSQKFNKEYSLYIFLIIGIIIGIFIGKRIWNKKKKLKANELEEQYKYIKNENLNDKNAILI